MLHVDNCFERDRCPLCESDKIRPVGQLGYRGKVAFSTCEIELSRVPELWKCLQCRSAFVQNTLEAETAKQLYSTGQAGARWSTAPFGENKTREVLAQMSEIFATQGNVLDVGCNTGELLDFARQLGCRTSGVEFSSASRDVLAGKGHTGYTTLDDTPGEYDVITAFDLVEHLYAVPAFLKRCHEKLSAKGRLVVLTGDINSLSASLTGSHWWYAQYPEHIVFPAKKYFSEYSGLRIEKWIPTYASVGYRNSTLRTGLEMLKGLVRGRRYSGLPALGPDHVLVVLRK